LIVGAITSSVRKVTPSTTLFGFPSINGVLAWRFHIRLGRVAINLGRLGLPFDFTGNYLLPLLAKTNLRIGRTP
jgi:hypothetical protein